MISFDVDNNKFNFRVSGIFLDKNGKRFLTNTRSNIDFCVLPGGRVEMGEDSKEALKREFREELGVEIEVYGIKALTENFFEFDNKNYHELQYVYVGKILDKSLEEHSAQFVGTEEKDIFEWKNVSDLISINYKPSYLKKVISEVADGNLNIRHIIHRGNG